MATTYNTLTLESATEKKTSVWKHVLVGFSVIAVAGLVAVVATASVRPASSLDAAFTAANGDVPTCDKDAAGFLDRLPKYDPEYSGDPDSAFYNACYYSYRCCTTTGNEGGCYVSANFGAECKSCLSRNGPRMVRGLCTDWLNVFGDPASAFYESDVDWTKQNMIDDAGFPDTNNAEYKLRFTTAQEQTCWSQAGPSDARISAYTEKCFEVVSWCNLLCPRDTPQSTDHKMCKNCELHGFAAAN